MKKTIFIGIAGASASGKTLIATELASRFSSEKLRVISEDAYYHDQSHMPLQERSKTNYDHPDAIDYDLMLQHMQLLRKGQYIEVPIYDYTIHNRSNEVEKIYPADIIIFEGILLFFHKFIRDFFDLRFFVDTPLDICLIRRLKRDISTRGRSMESILEQYLVTVRPMYLEFVESTRQYADLIIPQGGKNHVALDFIQTKLDHFIQQEKENRKIIYDTCIG